MEGAFLTIVGVMAIITVEITVMNIDVSDGKKINWASRSYYYSWTAMS